MEKIIEQHAGLIERHKRGEKINQYEFLLLIGDIINEMNKKSHLEPEPSKPVESVNKKK